MEIYVVEMPDGSEWGVPLNVIACSRAEYYADAYGGDVYRSLVEDTLPLFKTNPHEIFDWASNNMDWSDVQPYAQLIKPAPALDFQDGWVNGMHRVVNIHHIHSHQDADVGDES